VNQTAHPVSELVVDGHRVLVIGIGWLAHEGGVGAGGQGSWVAVVLASHCTGLETAEI
jgi:hypothetical protein